MTPEALADQIRRRSEGRRRFIVGVAGAPGSGKSTLAEKLGKLIPARVVPMDGFHYDNRILDAEGWRARKGAPHTFDVEGLITLIRRLGAGGRVAIPVFDRAMDLARAGAEIITDDDAILVVEGNYLLLDDGPWRELRPLFDMTVFLDVPEPVLEARLIQRWLDYGHSAEEARARAIGNDIPNARFVARNSLPAEITIRG